MMRTERRRGYRITGVYLLIMMPLVLAAQTDWDPVPESEWQVRADTAGTSTGAVMLFEKVVRNDELIQRKIVEESVYRRIRITSAQGRGEGNIFIIFDKEDEEITHVRARTIVHGGGTVSMATDQIQITDELKGEDLNLKRLSFSVPAITDDCIIEYGYVRVSKQPSTAWMVQKKIPLLRFEYRWKFSVSAFDIGNRFGIPIARVRRPVYVWMNSMQRLSVTGVPTSEDPEEVIFAADSLPPSLKEPYALSEIASCAQLHLFYSSQADNAGYWSTMGRYMNDLHETFNASKDAVEDIVKSFGSLATNDEKILAAYNWIQNNIRNTSYTDTTQELDENEEVEDVLEHRYGTQWEINLLFRSFMEYMKIPSKVCYVKSRSRGLFYESARYWQFDKLLIMVPTEKGDVRYFTPGDVAVRPGSIPWSYEGTTSLITHKKDEVGRLFGSVYFTEAADNPVIRTFDLAVDGGRDVRGTITETRNGHPARDLRLDLSDLTPAEMLNAIRDSSKENLPGWTIDSCSVTGEHDPSAPLTVRSSAHVRNALQRVAGNFLIRPFEVCAPMVNPFESERRTKHVFFPYAFRDSDVVMLRIPDSLTVTALPENVSFSNEAGSVSCTFRQEGGGIVATRTVEIRNALVNLQLYPRLRTLFLKVHGANESAVMIATGSGKANGVPR